MIPDAPARDTASGAEWRLFERLRDGTPDELVVFHSVAWLVPGDDGKPRQGEADFVLAHPERGALVLEVKGGSVRYDGASGKWFSTGKSGDNPIKDPAKQARRASFLLRDSLARATRGGGERVQPGYAVVFPDAKVDERLLKPDLPREIVVDHRDLDGLGARIDAVFRYWQGRAEQPQLGGEGVALLERVLAHSFTLEAPLAYRLRDTELELLRLTEQQFVVLDMLARHPRAAISGCAGSGKTFLAAEKARRLAAQGFRVLMLCFNLLLAEHLRRGLADVEAVDVHGFYELCEHVVREAGRATQAGDDHTAYTALSEAFAESVDIAAGRYDALIVDEAQDFRPEWWLPLQLLLKDPDQGPLYVFFDANQRLFPVPAGLPIVDEPYELNVNCRNTQRINRLLASYHDGTIRALGPEGVPVDVHDYSTPKDLLAQLEEQVERWTTEAAVPIEDIAVLTPKSSERSALWTVDRIGRFVLTDDPWATGKLLRSSIGRFKGLERMVVAIAELDGARDRTLYVGFSRPTVFLAIFCPPGSRRRLPL
jgi:hypothetical protein